MVESWSSKLHSESISYYFSFVTLNKGLIIEGSHKKIKPKLPNLSTISRCKSSDFPEFYPIFPYKISKKTQGSLIIPRFINHPSQLLSGL